MLVGRLPSLALCLPHGVERQASVSAFGSCRRFQREYYKRKNRRQSLTAVRYNAAGEELASAKPNITISSSSGVKGRLKTRAYRCSYSFCDLALPQICRSIRWPELVPCKV